MPTDPDPAATSLSGTSLSGTSPSGLPGHREAEPGANDGGRRGSPRPRWDAADLSYIAVFAALIAAFSLIPGIPLAAGVPITLQTLAVILTGMVLGPARGAAAAGLYVAAGLAGLPSSAASPPESESSPGPRPATCSPFHWLRCWLDCWSACC